MIYDAIIIGNGGAALSCAISLKQRNLNILVITKGDCTSAQTSQAQGGINAVINPNDSIENHIKDTLKSAHNIGDTTTIEYMCNNAKETILWLDSLGVPFNRDNNNNIAQRQLGGASYNRACYSSDYTGLKIVHTLFDTANKLDIEFLYQHNLLDIIVEDDISKGVIVQNIKNSAISQYLAKNIILATGGYGGVYHNYTTNSKGNVGDGIAIAYKNGAILENMEFVQFHPTAIKDKFILISESARGEGGYLITKDKERFVDELLPRDIVAREIYKKIQNNQEIFLDVRHLGYEKIIELLPQEYKLCLEHLSLRMDKDPIPITPASHYTMGGIKANQSLQTNIKFLYAVGECSNIGVHGANRLGGNSLLEIITFGKAIADNITTNNIVIDKEYPQLSKAKKDINSILNYNGDKNFYTQRDRLGEIMFQNVGLFREESKLKKALTFINENITNLNKFKIEDKSTIYNTNLKDFLEFRNSLYISKAIVLSALKREESRGSHYREDYPNSSKLFENTTLYIKEEVVNG